MKTGFLNDPARLLQDQIHSHALSLGKATSDANIPCLAQMQLRPCSSRVLPGQPTEVGGRPNLRRDPCSPIGSLVGVAPNQRIRQCATPHLFLLQHKWRVWNGGMCVCVLCFVYAVSSVCIRYRGDDSIRQALTFTCRRIYLPVLHLV